MCADLTTFSGDALTTLGGAVMSTLGTDPSSLILPQLPGLSWPVDLDFGSFDTTVETTVTGRESRYVNRVQARRRYGLQIDGLDSGGAFPGLGAQSLQTLAGFFARCYGGGLPFRFWDPADNAASGEAFGVGDGTTTAFQLARMSGGWVDYVFAPLVPSAPALIPSAAAPNAASANVYAPNNLVTQSAALATQTVAVAIGRAYVLSFNGTGSVALSGAATGSLAGLGAGTRVSRALTAATASLTLTVTGSVTSAQLEQSTATTPGPYFQTLAAPYFGGPWITSNGALVDPSAYTIGAVGAVEFDVAPAASAALEWTGNFHWWANWDDDRMSTSQIMAGLWEARRLSFTTRVF